MSTSETKRPAPQASRRGFLKGLAVAAGVTAAGAAAKPAQAQGAKGSGPILFHRTAETERYYKTVLPR
jgi:anaerobic selenocysteine-containing dehydrogenase